MKNELELQISQEWLLSKVGQNDRRDIPQLKKILLEMARYFERVKNETSMR